MTPTPGMNEVHVVMELVEGLLQIRVVADLRAHGDHLAARRPDEVPMRRNGVEEHVWWIGKARAGEHHQREP
jgi:hypothetical protein